MEDLGRERRHTETVRDRADLPEQIPRSYIADFRRKPRDVGEVRDPHADVVDVAAALRAVDLGLCVPELSGRADYVDERKLLAHRFSSGQSACRSAISMHSSIRSHPDFTFFWAW